MYVLPNTEPCREDFEWLRSEIVALGGEATVFAADALGPDGGDNIMAVFQRTRDADYEGLKRDAERVLSLARSKRAATAAGRDGLHRTLRSLRQRFTNVEGIDFFHARGRQDAAAALATVERLVAPEPVRANAPGLSVADFHHRRWVTRPRPGVDRMASAWLIRRYIDPTATFAFVDRPAPPDVAFDMYVGEFSHQGPLCTFETLTERFGLTDIAVWRIGQIVHDLDMKDTRYAPPEAPAVRRLVDGLRQLHADDHVLLQQGMAMFEALARSFATTEVAHASPRPTRPPKARKKQRRS